MATADLILQLTRQLYPTGRAFRMGIGSATEAMHIGLAVSEAGAWDDAASLMDSLLPDSERFTEDDTTDWERRLGIYSGIGTTLSERKAAIIQKLQAPGVNPAKGHYLYLQQQLQLAGFNVYVHENLMPVYPSGFENVSPASEYGSANLVDIQYEDIQYGGGSYGVTYNNMIANSLDQDIDSQFDLGDSFAATFFIGGQTLGTYANVPTVREQEFRKLILTLKPVQNIGFLFINYI